jgi:hypothetical protein
MPISKLELWVQSVLPTVYDDSLSYLEFLGKTQAKINELVDSDAQTRAIVDNFVSQFGPGLDQIVEDFLNVWITDGTIEEILSGALTSFNTALDEAVAEMQAMVNAKQATLISGDNIKTVNGESVLGAGNVDTNSDQPISVKKYGAKGDGVTDDTQAFNDALTACAVFGGTVHVPESALGYVIAGVITMPPYTTLVGCYVFPGQSSEALAWTPKGSTLLMTTLNSTIISSHGTSISGLTFYYPNQTNTNPPIAYPATIQMASEMYIHDHRIENCFVVNAYDFVSASGTYGRLTVKDIHGWCLHNFAKIDDAWDTCHVENVNLNPGFWWIFEGGDPLTSLSYAYSKANMTGVILGYNCSITIHNYLQTGGYYGFRFNTGIRIAEATYGMFSNISFDSVETPLYITDISASMGLQFTNLMCVASLDDIVITANDPEAIVHITNYDSTGSRSYNIIHAGNCGLFINNAKIRVTALSNLILFNTQIINAISLFKLANAYLCGVGNDLVRDIAPATTGVVIDASFDNCRYIAGGALPVVANLTANGTLKLRSLNHQAVGFLATQLVPATTPVVNTYPVNVMVIVNNSATAQGVKVNGATLTNLGANAVVTIILAPGDTLAMGTSSGGVGWLCVGI